MKFGLRSFLLYLTQTHYLRVDSSFLFLSLSFYLTLVLTRLVICAAECVCLRLCAFVVVVFVIVNHCAAAHLILYGFNGTIGLYTLSFTLNITNYTDSKFFSLLSRRGNESMDTTLFFFSLKRARTRLRVWIVLINKYIHEWIWYWFIRAPSLSLSLLTRARAQYLLLFLYRQWWLIIKLFKYKKKDRPFIWIHVLIVRHKVIMFLRACACTPCEYISYLSMCALFSFCLFSITSSNRDTWGIRCVNSVHSFFY